MSKMMIFSAGIVAGVLLLHAGRGVEQTLRDRIYARCEYDPHPISDVAWELYQRDLIPLGTALYYTRMVNSANIPAIHCLEEHFG